MRKTPGVLGSQSGQGIVEYILVLVVTVAIILGGLYQLNSAFKSWAQGYFGDYIACLLETGELPNIGGTPGDGGVCQQLFKPFSLAEGRPLMTKSTPSGGGPGSGGNAGGGRGTASARGGSATGGGSYSDGRFRMGGASSSRRAGAGGRRGGSDSEYTGSTDAGGYSGGYSQTVRQQNTGTKSRLDTRFAFDQESQDKQKRASFSTSKAPAADNGPQDRIRVHVKDLHKDKGTVDESPMTFGNFLRFLVIAAIIIALLVLVGGQMLQIGKSME